MESNFLNLQQMGNQSESDNEINSSDSEKSSENFDESKSEKDKNDLNVKQKQISALDFCKNINELPLENRMGADWSYSILDDKTFYAMKDKGANTQDLLEYCKITNAIIDGVLDL